MTRMASIVVASALVAVLAGALPIGAPGGAAPVAQAATKAAKPAAARINVRWAPDVTAAQRAQSEKRYGLADPKVVADDPRQRTWSYAVKNTSAKNLLALVHDPRAEDTAGVDRATGALTP